MIRARSLTLAITACAALTVLAGCSSSSPAPSSPSSAAGDAPASGSGDFCSDYRAAGGTLATPSNFQVGLPAAQTIADLGGRVDVLDAVTPPSEIATQWQALRDLYAEGVGIAEQLPAEESVVSPRMIELVKETGATGKEIRTYLDAEC